VLDMPSFTNQRLLHVSTKASVDRVGAHDHPCAGLGRGLQPNICLGQGGGPVHTNIRNTKSPHWRAWLKPEHRCVVPFTSFCEFADTKPRKTPTWFALNEDRPLAVFAGIWTVWHGRRGTKANPVEGEHQLFGFLTTNANAEVGAVHPKAMPVILTTETEIEHWMTAPAEEALKLQRPLQDGSLKIVMTEEKEDPMPD
jgi:putative SOS response-associated peptidase YedK